MTVYVTCSNEMSHMSKKKCQLVQSLERIFIKLSNGAKIKELAHAQAKLIDTEHAGVESYKLRKSHLKFAVTQVHDRVPCLVLIQLFCFYFTF